MGTHHAAPSQVLMEDGKTTSSLYEFIGHDLPYLFKVLSVARALSIQAHPNKTLAEKLHAERPTVYKDPNHKPELACAVTAFQAMCGFRPADRIAAFLEAVPELVAVVGQEVSSAFIAASKNANNDHTDELEAALSRLFEALMKSETTVVAAQLSTLIARLKDDGEGQKLDQCIAADEKAGAALHISELVPRLYSQYPGDVGVFAPFLLNCFVLQPGEAIYLSPNIPHAYLDGDCVEVMACSDNVVRAGLTPKLRDVNVLCSMLEYNCSQPAIMTGESTGACTLEYRVPIDEFVLWRTAMPSNTPVETLPKCATDAIILVYSGSATLAAEHADDNINNAKQQVKAGSIMFLREGTQVTVSTSVDETATLFMCASRK
jgi:mannose-6-phosphate isomerase